MKPRKRKQSYCEKDIEDLKRKYKKDDSEMDVKYTSLRYKDKGDDFCRKREPTCYADDDVEEDDYREVYR